MARPRLRLYPFNAGDERRFVPRADFAAEMDAVGWDWALGPPPGRAFTLYDARVGVLGVGGVFDAGDGVWYAWALLAALTPREIVEAGKLAAQAIAGVEFFNRPRRIVATARTATPGAVRLLEALGFEARGPVMDERVGPHVLYQLMIREAA